MPNYTEMEVIEGETSNDLILQMMQRPASDDLMIKGLFPEFDLSGLYGLHRAWEPLTKYLVMYDVVIVNLYLVKDIAHFHEMYGVSIEQMKTLSDLGKIHIVVCFPYEKFPPAFSSLLEDPRPRSSRTRNYLASVHDLSMEKRLQQVKSIAWLGEYSKYPATIDRDINTFWGMHASDLFDLDLVGLNDVADNLLLIAKIDPALSFKLTRDYCSLLARPIFDCLGGMNTFNKNDGAQARSILLDTDTHALATKYHFSADVVQEIEGFLGVHPSDLLSFFPEELYVPSFKGIEDIKQFVDQIEKQPDVVDFRKMLHQLAITQRHNPDLKSISNELISRLEKDAGRYGAKSKLFKDVMMIGVNSIPFAPALSGDIGLIKLSGILGPLYMSVVGSRSSQIETWSNRIFESLNNTHIEKPIVSAFHKTMNL